jgi:[ribosomal protein S5]-alanine N-acetyltransferase
VAVRLETERLVIRTFEPSDAAAWLAMVNNPDFDRFLPPSPPATLEDFRAMVERRRTMENERGFAMWAVDVKDDGFAGQCGLYPADADGPEVELAYHFNASSWNKGFATEAAGAVLDYALGPVGLTRVIAFVMPENVASCRVAEKVGMRLEAEGISAHELDDLRRYAVERH